jgi:hypothetical protein
VREGEDGRERTQAGEREEGSTRVANVSLYIASLLAHGHASPPRAARRRQRQQGREEEGGGSGPSRTWPTPIVNRKGLLRE